MSGAARKKRSAASASAAPQQKRYKTSSVDLNEDALSLVMEFLAPKELYRMSLTCKALRACVTTKMVVRSAIMQGGNVKTSVKELYDLLKKNAIHAPSALRLLRLVNGKCCEVCHSRRVNHVKSGFGVFICSD